VFEKDFELKGEGYFLRVPARAELTVSKDELDVDFQKTQYKFQIPADTIAYPRPYKVTWFEVFTPKDPNLDDDVTPEKVCKSFTEEIGEGKTETKVHIIDPSTTPDKEGVWTLLPVDLTVAFGVGPDIPDGAVNKSSRELLEEYLDGIKLARQGDVWAVKGKDQQGNEKIWGVEIVTAQDKLNAALSANGRYVVYDGHSNFGLGPDFGGIPIRSINDFTNFGSKYTDVPLDFRYRGNNPNPERDAINWGKHGYPFLVLGNNEIQTTPTNYKPLPINELRFPNTDGIGDGQVFPRQGLGFETWHYRFDANSKRLMITAPKTDLPATLRYKSFFYNVCSSGIDYIENFKHGEFYYTKDSCFVHRGTQIFVQGVIEGKSSAQIKPLLNQLGVGSNEEGDIIYEFHNF
jgi:hypothetical protein